MSIENPRSITIQGIEVQDAIEAEMALPTTPPNEQQREAIEAIALRELASAAQNPDHEGMVLWAAVGFPQTGPATLGFLWALNPRHPHGEHLALTYSETRDDMLSLEQAEHHLAEYAVGQFGKPRAV